jgi:hypothetical protein
LPCWTALLDFLNGCAVADLPAQVQAEALLALERVESKHTVARARVLAAFSAQDGHYVDGAAAPGSPPACSSTSRCPSCAQPASVCEIHHLIAVHRWGWTLTLNLDGTTTATSPDRQKILHSHGPPAAA